MSFLIERRLLIGHARATPHGPVRFGSVRLGSAPLGSVRQGSARLDIGFSSASGVSTYYLGRHAKTRGFSARGSDKWQSPPPQQPA